MNEINDNMEREIVSWNVAKLAKEKGFDLMTFYYYADKGSVEYGIEYDESDCGCCIPMLYGANWNDETRIPYPQDPNYVSFSAPFSTQLLRWLREKHKIHVWVTPIVEYGNVYSYMCSYYAARGCNDDNNVVLGEYKTYEDALETALLESLKITKNK